MRAFCTGNTRAQFDCGQRRSSYASVDTVLQQPDLRSRSTGFQRSCLKGSRFIAATTFLALLLFPTSLTLAQKHQPEDRFGRQLKLRQEQRWDNGHGKRGEQDMKPRMKSESSERWEEFRFYDGSGNNLLYPNWGKSRISLRRVAASQYSDGFSEPARYTGPNARVVSNLLCSQDSSMPEPRGLSDMAWQWGQFLDHDITLVETALPSEPFPILIPPGDAWFDPDAVGSLRLFFYRSEYFHVADFPRQQINSITAWIDGSQVYGSDQETSDSLRSFSDGKLKTSDGDLLPVDEEGFFLAGDIRVNEQVGLTAMHTLFVREHNRIAGRLAHFHPDWSDEEIFQQARREVIGILQAITYNEFLPALLGRDAIPPYRGYRPDIDPSITNEFATAAYRLGHSMLNENLLRLDPERNEMDGGALPLRAAFFNPIWLQADGIDPYLQGLIFQRAQNIDTRIVDDVRNFLFGAPGAGGLDLAAFNIQRGRDHGLADYNSIRQRVGLPAVTDFDELPMNESMQTTMAELYADVDQIDPWVGMLAEQHLPGCSVGETMRQILVMQFVRLRDGDRFWYQRMVSDQQRQRIHQTRLSHVLHRNSGVRKVQMNVFFSVQ